MNRSRSLTVSPLHPLSTKFDGNFFEPLSLPLLSRKNALCSSIFNSSFSFKASPKCHLPRNNITEKPVKALSLLLFQVLELSAALFLLSRTIKPEYDLVNFFKTIKSPAERNWLLASALGFAVLTSLVFLASLVADRLFGAKAANNPLVREILLSSDISATAIVLVNCIIAPLLEEAVYRGFLLTSLASTMSWRNAVVISSAIFSVAHFSIDNFLQLFIIGLFVSHFFRFLLLRKQRALPIPSPVALPFPLHRPLRHLSTHQRSHSVGVAQSLKPLLSRSKH
ncbi:hypothetical protein CUMW_181390 [Citrus unshiu]|uniref:CAAX prenyl protease 2/Lysostaphin resistance protein A-like domain-containing protein n=1 Tax=Citrus unshiu TaxID=55188 RepID=A0A2H5PZ84_CITUN|nr:hypothetical protein CUMW_181390 [Citrus unshiu]